MIPHHDNHVRAWVRHHARQLSRKALTDGFQPAALHEYIDAVGQPLFWRIRLKNPDTADKWIRPMRRVEGGDFDLKQPEFPNGLPLYRLPELAGQPDAPVWIVEGETCADALTGLGTVATTSGGADSASRADWSILAGRTVTIWPDNDEAGRRYADTVAGILRGLGCVISILDAAALDLPTKGDAVDWLTVHPDATADEVANLPRLTGAGEGNDSAESIRKGDDYRLGLGKVDEADEEKERISQASALVAFVQERADLFHDENREVYAQDRESREVRRIDGHPFKDWLLASFYKGTGKSARDQSLREAVGTLSGLGRYDGECKQVSVRVAHIGGAYFLDLGIPGQSRAVKIEPGRWQIVENPEAMFVRTESMRPLPTPARDGDLSGLWALVNIPDDARLLVLAWLAECLRPDTPFPVLELIGEQGSAKSTTQSILRRLIDPNACDLRAAPKNTEDVFVGAGVNWMVSYENVSHLAAPMQDALCVLATGGGFAKRKLYSDADETVIQTKRPIVLNGISACITAQDLIDRSVSVETPVITTRTEMTAIWSGFGSQHASLLGGFLDLFAEALQRLPGISIPTADRPRLIEFARLGMAMAEAAGKPGTEFMRQFNASRQESIARTIDASPVATALLEWFEARHKVDSELAVKTLFGELERFKPQQTDAWPRSAKGLGDALRRAAPALRHLGVECRSLGKQGGSVKWSIIKGKLLAQCPESPEVLPGDLESTPDKDIGTFRTSVRELSPAGFGADDDVEVF